MKAKDVVLVGLIISLLIVLWLFIDKMKRAEMLDKVVKKLTKENEQLKKGYLELLEKYLRTQAKVTPDVITELQRLKSKVDHLDTKVHVELESVINLVNQGEGVKAVKDLAKIVEVQLKNKVKEDESFKFKPTLQNLLQHAKLCNWIKPSQFENGQLLRELRNKESHEIAVQEEPYRIGLAIFSGIDIIFAISKN